MKQMGRREFIKYSGGLIGFVLLGKYIRFPFSSRASGQASGQESVLKRAADGLGTVADPANRFAMVIDVGACIGCRRCQWGCKEENNIPDTISPPWIEVFEVKSDVSVGGHPSLQDLKEGVTTSYTESPREGRWYLPAQCNHCDNPPCVKVCPVGATYKDKDGLVLMNYDRCIGCRICVVACPYSARRFNWLEPEIPADETNPLVPVRPLSVVEKCTFCVHRTRQGKLPRCVEVCPVRARHFGNINDPESEVAKILETNLSFRLLEEANTHPHIWYITRGKKWLQ
ncbi:MAG: 4Fe-4S dicluster domain-containing protein [Dehalococcoidales bacterium]|nr:4Fe-4S dicluster domain-containing protein [Dehalococcoidales bacterium]